MKQFTNLDETNIRRINRLFQIIQSTKTRIEVFLPLSITRRNVETIEKDVCLSILFIAGHNYFGAIITKRTIWKRHYWRKWKTKHTSFVLHGETAFELLKKVKPLIETEVKQLFAGKQNS